MKKTITKNTRERQITRRGLIGGALVAAGGVITGAPAFLRGQNLNDKLNIAMIACGGRANANMRGDGGGRRGTGATSGPPTGIPAENITVLCDVNQHAVDAAAQRFPKAKTYNDFRRVFDSPNDFDAVMVSTTEHTHTLATYLALTHGKHVYCEKPLTHDVWEARLIRETAAKYPKLATQTGNQGHASPVRRQIKELIMAGAIGPVREVHVWAGRAWGLQSAASAERYDKPHGFYNGIQITDRFKEEMPVPPNIDWDLWIGPAPMRPFHATNPPRRIAPLVDSAYLTWKWRCIVAKRNVGWSYEQRGRESETHLSAIQSANVVDSDAGARRSARVEGQPGKEAAGGGRLGLRDRRKRAVRLRSGREWYRLRQSSATGPGVVDRSSGHRPIYKRYGE